MKKLLILTALAFITQCVHAQVWYTKNGYVSFYSHTSVEDIKAENNEVLSFFDTDKGEFRFQVLIKGFKFPKAAMQQHFNDVDYMNSDKFPKADFKGTVVNFKPATVKKDGTYNVMVDGEMTLHGETKKIRVPGVITVSGGKVNATATFKVKRTDFKISTPSFTATKIADEIEVTVKCNYEPYSK